MSIRTIRGERFAAMVGLINDLLRRPGISERIWGVGVALPGPLIETDISFVGPTALEGWKDLSILDELRDGTAAAGLLQRRQRCRSVGRDVVFGVAKSLDNFFYMHFGVDWAERS